MNAKENVQSFEDKVRNILSNADKKSLFAEEDKSLFDIVLNSFVDFFETENAAVYCLMTRRCYSLYLLFKPFIEKRVNLEEKNIINDKNFLCVKDKINGLLAENKKFVLFDESIYTFQSLNSFISKYLVRGCKLTSDDIIVKGIFISDSIIVANKGKELEYTITEIDFVFHVVNNSDRNKYKLNIFAQKCEIGAMREYSDRFWTAIEACGKGYISIAPVISLASKNIMSFVKTIEDFSGYKFKLENSNFVVREFPYSSFRDLIAEKSDIRYFCAVPENLFGIEINTPEDLEKAKYMRSILFSYDSGVLRFYPFITSNINKFKEEKQDKTAEIFESVYGEYFHLPNADWQSRRKLAIRRLGFLNGIELSIEFLKAIFGSNDINSFKDFCKIENTDILFNNFISENNSLTLEFLSNLPKTDTVYNRLDAKKINIELKNQKTLGSCLVEEFITDADIQKYYSGYEMNKLIDFTGFWGAEIDEMVDSLKANENEKHLPNIATSIFDCLKTFFSEKGKVYKEMLKHLDAVVAAFCFSNECCTLIIGSNAMAHTGEGAAFVASRDFPYLAQTADIFRKTLKK